MQLPSCFAQLNAKKIKAASSEVKKHQNNEVTTVAYNTLCLATKFQKFLCLWLILSSRKEY